MIFFKSFEVKQLMASPKGLIAWCSLAAFGAYFCMYALRKPFSTGLYTGLFVWGIPLKTALVTAQVTGYMFSKFIGIKIISELNTNNRIKYLVGLLAIAQLALLGFALAPLHFKVLCIFINGLPLGMVWGVVFSFLEGRLITEFIVLGLGVNLVVGSGILKGLYFVLQRATLVEEIWMPAFIGFCSLPFFSLFVYMLACIPAPNLTDIEHRSLRPAMTQRMKQQAIAQLGLPIICIVIVYTILTIIRDYRDNFLVEIWSEIGLENPGPGFVKTEILTGIIVLILIIIIGKIKNNKKAFYFIILMAVFGICLLWLANFGYHQQWLDPYTWVLLLGMGLFIPYILIQSVLFERLIALLRLQANAGYFVYICDSMGYLGSFLFIFVSHFYQPIQHHYTVLQILSQLSIYLVVFLLLFVFWLNIKIKSSISLN